MHGSLPTASAILFPQPAGSSDPAGQTMAADACHPAGTAVILTQLPSDSWQPSPPTAHTGGWQ
jgi:hypothetical protein